ncbi:MAG TPA: DUF4232 domain-containing protein [Mycobacteriales bacterium]|nr:DUF4232 domain-containing protein [Mycobacteriales bacterium]
MTARAWFARLALAAFVVAGCSSSSSGGSDNTAATEPPVTSSPSVSTSESASQSATPTPSFSSTVQASKDCRLSQLDFSIGQGQGAAGSTILPLVFTNHSKRACTMFGYPGVSFLDAQGNPLGQPADRRGGEKAVVTLGPGDAANAQLRIPDPGNFSPADCNVATSASILVYPPGEKHSTTAPEATQVCTTEAGRSVVLPVVPGNGG